MILIDMWWQLDVHTLLSMGYVSILILGLTVFIVTLRRGFVDLWTWSLANLTVLAFFVLITVYKYSPSPFFAATYYILSLLGLFCFIATSEALLTEVISKRKFLAGMGVTIAFPVGLSFIFEERWLQTAFIMLAAAIICGYESIMIARLRRRSLMKNGAWNLVVIFAIGAFIFAATAVLMTFGALKPSLGLSLEALESIGIFNTIILSISLNLSFVLILTMGLESAITAKVYELGKSRDDLQILYEAFTQTAGSVDLEGLIPRILDLLSHRLSVDMSALYLRERGGDTLTLLAQRGLDADAIGALIGTEQNISLAWQSYIENRASIRMIRDYPEGLLKEALTKLELNIFGGFPIATQGEALGSLTIGYKDASMLDASRISLLETMSFQLGIVVKAANLHEELTSANKRLDILASTDALTGLANRRAAIRVFEREAARARRDSGLIVVIMCDIDHFKLVNDENGHDCGDFILANTAATIMQSVRTTDVVARWGGEEFLIILGKCEPSDVVVLAERIRKQVEASVWDFFGKRLSVTITLGCSICSAATDGDKAISIADEALYEGKQNGRNRVVIRPCACIPPSSLAVQADE